MEDINTSFIENVLIHDDTWFHHSWFQPENSADDSSQSLSSSGWPLRDLLRRKMNGQQSWSVSSLLGNDPDRKLNCLGFLQMRQSKRDDLGAKR